MKLSSIFQKVAFIALPILTIIAHSNFARSDSQNINCNNPQTTVQMRNCANEKYQQADRKLNQVDRQLKPKLNPSRQKKLVDAQLAWIQFRDKSCQFEASYAEGGTLEPVLKLSCLADLTEQRVKKLEKYLQSLRS